MTNKFLIISFSLFLITSCTKRFDVKEGNGQVYIDDIESSIFEIKEDNWLVGKRKIKEISKGIKFKFKIPKINKKDSAKLNRAGGIDSWIFKVSRLEKGRKRPIGHILYGLNKFNNVSDNITAHIYYHAAAAGNQFRRKKCPAFNHRKKIISFELLKNNSKSYDLFVKRKKIYRPSQMEKPSFSPIIFSGDNSLVGRFVVELALMNSTSHILYSKWVQLNNSIEVKMEKDVVIPECVGVRSEIAF